MVEYWMPVSKYANYAVSSLGRVFNIKHKRFLKPIFDRGYLFVGLCENGVRTKYPVHRLVFQSFKREIPKSYQINHINCDKQDNRIVNLECCTPKENTVHAALNGLLPRGEKTFTAKLNVRKVKTMRYLYFVKKIKARKLAKMFGVDKTQVINCVKNRSWKHVPFTKVTKNLLDSGFKHSSGSPGERNPKSKLKANDVKCIRKKYKSGDFSLKFFAEKYNVTKTLISNIVLKKCWRHI